MKEIKKLKYNLPKHPGILGKEEFFNSAVLIPLVLLDDEYHFIFEKRNANIRQGGEICFPGGRIDNEDLDATETALRETYEEIGVDSSKIEVIGKLDFLFGPRGVLVEPVVALININSIDELVLQESEVEKVLFVPVSFFEENEPERFKIHSYVTHKTFNSKGEEEEIILEKNKNETYYQNVREVLVYKTEGEIIWGITARLVYEVILKLNSKKID